MTVSHAESTSDSCARTEYDNAGRGRSSAPNTMNAATRGTRPEHRRGALQRSVVKRGLRVSSSRLRTLRQMLCNQGAACGFGFGVTRKSEQPTTVPK